MKQLRAAKTTKLFIVVIVASLIVTITQPIIINSINSHYQILAEVSFAEKRNEYKSKLLPYAGQLRSFAHPDNLKGTTSKQKLNDIKNAGLDQRVDGKERWSDYSVEESTTLENDITSLGREKNWINPRIILPHVTNADLPLVFELLDGNTEIYGGEEDIDDSNKISGFISNIVYKFTITNDSYTKLERAGILSSKISLVFDMNGIGSIYEGTDVDFNSASAVYGGECGDASNISNCLVRAAEGASDEQNRRSVENFESILLPAEPDKGWFEEYVWDSEKSVWINAAELVSPLPLDWFGIGLTVDNGIKTDKAYAIWGSVIKIGAKGLTFLGKKQLLQSIKKKAVKVSEAGLARIAKNALKQSGKSIPEDKLSTMTSREIIKEAGSKGLLKAFGSSLLTGVMKTGKYTAVWAWANKGKFILVGAAAAFLAVAENNIGCGSGDSFNQLLKGNLHRVLINFLDCVYEALLKPGIDWSIKLLQQASSVSVIYNRKLKVYISSGLHPPSLNSSILYG